MSLNTEQKFFYAHAGYSYGPNETAKQGKERCARKLARAEREAFKRGYSFAWSIDPDIDSSDHDSADEPAYALWQCVARDAYGKVVASLHGIDFGRDGEPWGDNYRRVVEAELAEEALDV